MHSDPGWLSAVKYGFLAIFARNRVMRVRPALTAARAGTLSYAYLGLGIAGVLTFLGETEEPDYLFAGLIVILGSIASGLAVLFLRYRPPWRLHGEGNPVKAFIASVTVTAAFASVPMLIAFVTFFLGGGYVMYSVGAFVSLVLLLGPGRPSEAMVHRLAEGLGPEVSPAELWENVLDPTPVA